MVDAAVDAPITQLPVILVADDEEGVRDALAATLGGAGYSAITAANGAEAFAAALACRPDLILLDLRMPVLDGLTVARQLRAAGCSVPILVISGYADIVQTRIDAYHAGAQDVLTKPWDSGELLAIVDTQLARARTHPANRVPPGTLRVADLELSVVTGRATRAGRVIDLLPVESRVLTRLMLTPGVTVPFATLAADVWPDSSPDRPVYEPHISHLRKKIDVVGERPLIHTVKGIGYVIGPLARSADRGAEVRGPTTDQITAWGDLADNGPSPAWRDPIE